MDQHTDGSDRSVLSLDFVSSSISTTVRTDVTTANEPLVKLRAELGAPNAPTAGTPEKPALPAGVIEGDVLTQLQQYACEGNRRQGEAAELVCVKC